VDPLLSAISLLMKELFGHVSLSLDNEHHGLWLGLGNSIRQPRLHFRVVKATYSRQPPTLHATTATLTPPSTPATDSGALIPARSSKSGDVIGLQKCGACGIGERYLPYRMVLVHLLICCASRGVLDVNTMQFPHSSLYYHSHHISC
jgi:hypothetical protein